LLKVVHPLRRLRSGLTGTLVLFLSAFALTACIVTADQSIESNPRFAEGHIFLAKAYLDSGRNFDEAIALARKGLDLKPTPDIAPLAHYVMADVYSRQGHAADSNREAALGRALEARAKSPRG